MYRFVLQRTSANPGAVPQMQVLVLLRMKGNYDTPGTPDFGQLKYQNSNTGTIAKSTIISLDARTIVSPFNTDVFDILLVKKFNCGAANNAAATSASNEHRLQIEGSIDVTPYVKKVWTFNDSVTNQPENEGIFACWFGVTQDGNAYTSINTVNAVASCAFTDA